MNLNYHGLVDRIRQQVPETSPDDLASRMDTPPVILDVREPEEVRTGMIPGSYHVPRGVLEGLIERIVPDRATEVVLVCSGGHRSILAAASLQSMGYESVSSLAGGTALWRLSGHPLVVPGAGSTGDSGAVPDADTETRYLRQVVLEGVGREGQQRLAQASVAIVGLGGLGSPVALYLAAAGVGRLALIDPDVVDVSNLQRQVIHDTTRLGVRKVDSAAESIRRLNPLVGVDRHPVAASAENILDLLSGLDVVVDATDSFPARYLINDAALHLRIPVVHGSVLAFEGQVTVFDPYRGPCYRCLFPEPPPPELAPNCAQAGVLGVLPGTIGTLQATEALKLILGVGEPLVGWLLTHDARGGSFARLRFGRDPACPACGDEENPPALVDYDERCVAG